MPVDPSPFAERAGLSPEVVRDLRDAAPVVSVVGDLMLDGWWSGTTERMTREAPAPVVEVRTRRSVPGGAANTAVNLAALGARVRIAGVVGDDDAGRRLTELLAAHGVDTSGVVRVRGRATVAKNRVMVDDTVLLRLDDLAEGDAPAASLAALAEGAVAQTAGADALLVCDYGSGTLTGAVLDALTAAPRPPLVVVDAHDLAPWARLRPDLVTPNAGETSALVGVALGDQLTGDQRVARVADAADGVLTRSGARAAVVTLDRDGSVLLAAEPIGPDGTEGSGGAATPAAPAAAGAPGQAAPPAVRHRTWARPASERRASGAGDSFVAALTLGRACGLPLSTSLDLAQAAADVVVQRFGTSVCSTDDLVGHLDRTADSLHALDDLVRLLDEERAAGKRIVLTNGCFDVLHRGHTRSLTQAKELGDVLVVALNDDASTARLKGPGRPVNPLDDRAGVLRALSCVDYVTSFGTDTATPLIERLRPDVYAKGGDYTPQMLEETAAVVAAGGQVRILDYVADKSTTAVVDRIRGATP